MSGSRRASNCSRRRRSTHGAATNWRSVGRRCPGCESRRPTTSIPTKAARRWRTSSEGAPLHRATQHRPQGMDGGGRRGRLLHAIDSPGARLPQPAPVTFGRLRSRSVGIGMRSALPKAEAHDVHTRFISAFRRTTERTRVSRCRHRGRKPSVVEDDSPTHGTVDGPLAPEPPGGVEGGVDSEMRPQGNDPRRSDGVETFTRMETDAQRHRRQAD